MTNFANDESWRIPVIHRTRCGNTPQLRSFRHSAAIAAFASSIHDGIVVVVPRPGPAALDHVLSALAAEENGHSPMRTHQDDRSMAGRRDPLSDCEEDAAA